MHKYLKLDEFEPIVSFPERGALTREIRFCMTYFKANKLLVSAKW